MVFTFFKHFHSKSECFESFTCDYAVEMMKSFPYELGVLH